ncbi:ATP-dependent DNA ligase [Candidatus Microgenomates bacterium CPR3]|nr:ATP-dependent DNA ligase [Candidatus Microgenomates bacterium CPR3]
MLFSDLCKYFERIEATAKRLEKTEILAELLKKIEHEEVRVVINLALGQLAAPYMRRQFNLAEKMLVRAIAQSVRMGTGEVTTLAGSGRTILELYERLVVIARDSGTGSQERKQSKLAELLTSSSAIEAKYIVRMVNESLRLGFSESTMLDVLSYWVSGNKDYSERLERAYQMRPDVALLGEEVIGKGIEGALTGASVVLGVPVIPALAQRLASVDEMIEKMGRVYVEPKLDGTRVQIHYSTSNLFSELDSQPADQQTMFEDEKPSIWVKTYTRNLDENTAQFPELLQIKDEIDAESVILDAEAVGYDPETKKLLPFQMTITRKRKHGVVEATKNIPLRFFVFDILYLNGVSLIDKPLSERRNILEKVLKPKSILSLNSQIETDDPNEIRQYHAEQLSAGLEGVLVKKVSGVYQPGRSGFNWVKLKEVENSEGKLSDTIDCVVMGYYWGKGKRSGFGIGAFLVGVAGEDKILTIAKIGTGLTDEQFKLLYGRLGKIECSKQPDMYVVEKSLTPDVWVEPRIVVEIAADEITTSPSHSAGYSLRFPRLVKFRDDKSVTEITTYTEIEQMYGQ